MCINCERYKKEKDGDKVIRFLNPEPTGIYPSFNLPYIREVRCEPNCPLCKFFE